MLSTLLLVAQDSARAGVDGYIENLRHSPKPFNPFVIYLVIMLVLWLLALRARKKDTFEKQAQDVLEEKYASGEITKKTYDKYRQDVSLRPKR